MKIKNCFVVTLGVAALFFATSCGNTKVKKSELARIDSLATTYVNPLFPKGPCFMKVFITICTRYKIVWYFGKLQILPM